MATPRTIGRPARRTQVERSAATRAALLDATIACLLELGYEQTTTLRVAERAGLSRGAHTHHFQTRQALVAAAIEEMARRRGAEISAELARLPGGEPRITLALDLFWRWYTSPLFYAFVDLAAAARTDADLRASLAPVERELGHMTLLLAREMFADGRRDARLDPLIAMTLGTVRGLALLPLLQPPGRSAAAQWRFARDRLAELFSTAARRR
jgi:AcrR family transcriptional regulator